MIRTLSFFAVSQAVAYLIVAFVVWDFAWVLSAGEWHERDRISALWAFGAAAIFSAVATVGE